jgi:hypothetical protein
MQFHFIETRDQEISIGKVMYRLSFREASFQLYARLSFIASEYLFSSLPKHQEMHPDAMRKSNDMKVNQKAIMDTSGLDVSRMDRGQHTRPARGTSFLSI